MASLRTFALIVCAQHCCTGNATGPENKHGVKNAREKILSILLLWIIGDPYFFNHESLTLLTILLSKYDKMKKISP